MIQSHPLKGEVWVRSLHMRTCVKKKKHKLRLNKNNISKIKLTLNIVNADKMPE